MPDLNGTQTHDNLKTAFAGESQANRRYLYFAQKADVEGYPDVAALFRSVAEGETGHARPPAVEDRNGDAVQALLVVAECEREAATPDLLELALERDRVDDRPVGQRVDSKVLVVCRCPFV